MEYNFSPYKDYSLFFKFFVAYSERDFKSIRQDDALVSELDYFMGLNNQLFYISDVIQLQIKYISEGVNTMFGIEQDKVNPGFFLTTTHPDDLRRHHLARIKLISVAQELYMRKSGTKIISIDVRGRKPGTDAYADYMYQGFLFYSKIPYESVFLILIITDISQFNKFKKGFHYYIGNDPDMFRFPDEKLLTSGLLFSHTEFRILELIEEGLSTKEIAEKLFRSPLTVNTHRTNILRKSGKASTTEVIHYLKDQGLL